jgi:SNF2 family DNA or RNA helicase
LTGSPVDNAPFAAYSQFEILGDAMLGHATFAEFKAVYGIFEPQGYGGNWRPKVIGYQNLEVLKAKIERVSSIVGREGLSEFVHTIEYFEMTPKQEALYKNVKKDLLIALDSGLEIKSPEAGAKLIKLQQIASGFIIDTDRQDVHELVPLEENPRLAKLLEVLETAEGKSIIWCTFREELKIVAKFLRSKGYSLVEYHGQIRTEHRNKAIDAFQKDPSVKLFLGQPAAGGEGLNLSAASNVIWFSHVFDAIKRNQASERATTTGGKNIALIDICAVGTVDEKILADLGKKKVTAESLIQSLRLG